MYNTKIKYMYLQNSMRRATIEHLAKILGDFREIRDVLHHILALHHTSKSGNTIVDGGKESGEETGTLSSNHTANFLILLQHTLINIQNRNRKLCIKRNFPTK